MTPFSAVVMAAGQGTRMRSARPKVLHDLCGRPLVAWPIRAARDAGAGSVIVVHSPGLDLGGTLEAGVQTAIQERADGTGGAVAAALPALPDTGTVIVINGDVPLVSPALLSGLVHLHAREGAAATVVAAHLDDPTGYGRVVRDAAGHVERIVETKKEEDAGPEVLAIAEVNAGIYCFDLAALRVALPQLTTDNAQGELYLPQVVDVLVAEGRTVAALVVDDVSVVLGVNDLVQLAEVRVLAQRRILEEHMRAGVTIIDPASTYVDAGVTIGADAILRPGTALHGASSVGPGAEVGPHTTVLSSSIGEGAKVRHAHLDQAQVGPGATVGPYASLRPGTVLREGSKAGTFVELKNTDLGAGSKVPHLSYIGDANIGPEANLGAATITANYDSKRRIKHPTTIGAGVKTGVDTTLVAPVKLGDRAFTAAGSIITEDIPEAGLGIARGRQTNIDGYADRD